MNNEQLPELQHEVDSKNTSPEDQIIAKKLPGWSEHTEAVLGEDGVKRDQDGKIVPYPHHLTTP